MRHSFRARIILLSMGVSGLVLVVFALSAIGVTYRRGLQRIDREMADRVGPLQAVSHPREHWRWIAASLEMAYGAEGVGGCILLVKGGRGEVLERSENWPDELSPERFPAPLPRRPAPPGFGFPPPPAPPGTTWGPPRGGPPEFSTRRTRRGSWRVCAMPNDEATLVLGVSLAGFEAEMGRMQAAFLGALPAALLAIGLGSWLVSRRALRSVEELAQAAERVTASTLDQRIPEGGLDTEFRRLTAVLNGMLDRLERSFAQAARFSADAAHELKTPLTILQGEIEQALQDAPEGSEPQRVFSGLLEELHRLKEIVRKLLLLSQADAGKLPLNLEPFDLAGEIESVCEDAEAMAPHLAITHELEAGLQVRADADLLSQVLRNLTLNAVKHNRDEGRIEYRLRRAGSAARLTIANTGTAIPLEHRDRVFERFYRADPSRSRRVDGVGLGLSLAREIVRAHGGELTLADSGEDLTVFCLTLPLASGERQGGV